MINRRLIRVKVFKTLFGRVSAEAFSLTGTQSELILSCEKSLELYYFILSLPVALKKIAYSKIETGLKKFHPTEEEKNNMRDLIASCNDYVNKKIVPAKPVVDRKVCSYCDYKKTCSKSVKAYSSEEDEKYSE